MIYITKAGIGLEVGRIHRQHIDNLLARRPMPEPPTCTVTVWGGIEEEEPLWNDPEYQSELAAFWLMLGRDELEIVTPAVTITNGLESVDASTSLSASLSELEEAGITQSDPVGRLRAGVLSDQVERQAVIELVFYQSTVTQRGIDEATAAFRVLWLEKPVLAWKVPGAPAEYAPVYRDRQAARSGGYSWERFCQLPGPEQSAEVAFYMIERRLAWLMSKLK